MIKLEVCYFLLATATIETSFEGAVLARRGLLQRQRRKTALGEFYGPVTLTWWSGLLAVPQILCDIVGWTYCDVYSLAVLLLTTQVAIYTLAFADLASQLSLTLAAAEQRAVDAVQEQRRLHARIRRGMLCGWLVPMVILITVVSNLKECSDRERHYFWGVVELILFGACLTPAAIITAWCAMRAGAIDRELQSAGVRGVKVLLARPLLQTLWPCITLTAVALGTIGAIVPLQMTMLGNESLHPLYTILHCVACATALLCTQCLRAAFIAGLVHRCPNAGRDLRAYTDQFTSGKLAELAGAEAGHSAADVLAQGLAMCRTVRPSQLSPQAFETSWDGLCEASPCPTGEECAQPDFFFSHSWRDSAADKWQMLSEASEHFQAVHGREPNVWIDKYCIDQLHIDESLLFLPVFASASRTVLVAIGPSYFTRLWCVWEMFVLAQGGFHNVVFWPLPCAHDWAAQLASFCLDKVDCFKPEDKRRILAAVESLHGGVAQFNQVIRDVVQPAVKAAAGDRSLKPSLKRQTTSIFAML